MVNEHCLIHNKATDHPLTLSFTDLSVWCYKCEDYIDNPILHKYKNLAHISKFGEELVWSYGNNLVLAQQESDDEWHRLMKFFLVLVAFLLINLLWEILDSFECLWRFSW